MFALLRHNDRNSWEDKSRILKQLPTITDPFADIDDEPRQSQLLRHSSVKVTQQHYVENRKRVTVSFGTSRSMTARSSRSTKRLTMPN